MSSSTGKILVERYEDGTKVTKDLLVSLTTNEDLVRHIRAYNSDVADEVEARFRFYFDNIAFEQWKNRVV
jgi:hypothetical protein